MVLRLIGKRALITGATSGVGLKITELLLARGVHVTAVGRRIEQLDRLKKDFDRLKVYSVDMIDSEHFSHFIKNIEIEGTYDYLINCAGFAEYGPLINQDDDVIADMIHVNLTQTVILTKHVLLKMNPRGMVVTIGSLSSKVTTPFGAIYAASKSGINQVMNALRLEQSHIHFLTVNTGPVNTQFIQKANKGKPMNHLAERLQLDVNQLSMQIVNAMIDRKTELNLPVWMDSGLKIYGLAPRKLEKIFKKYFMTKK